MTVRRAMFVADCRKCLPSCSDSRRRTAESFRTIAWTNLPVEVVHVVDAVRAGDGYRRRAVLLRQPRDARQVHLSDDVELGFVGRAEDFEFAELVPAVRTR